MKFGSPRLRPLCILPVALAIAGLAACVMLVEQAREAVQSETLVLVDIRTPREWRESGIPDVAVALDMTAKAFVPTLVADTHPR